MALLNVGSQFPDQMLSAVQESSGTHIDRVSEGGIFLHEHRIRKLALSPEMSGHDFEELYREIGASPALRVAIPVPQTPHG